MDGLASLVKAAFNIGTSIVVGSAAIINRHGTGTLNEFFQNSNPKINRNRQIFGRFNKKFIEISPALEHIAFGYSITAVGYGIGNSVSAIVYLLGNLTSSTNFETHFFGLGAASAALSFDLLWEYGQYLKRGKFQPIQFLGTVAGAGTSVYLNNSYFINNLADLVL